MIDFFWPVIIVAVCLGMAYFIIPPKRNVDFLKPTYTSEDIKLYRKEHGTSLHEAHAILHKEFLLDKVDQAESIDELAQITRELIEKVM